MVQVKGHMQLKDQAQCIPPACQFSRVQQQAGQAAGGLFPVWGHPGSLGHHETI